MNFLYQCLFIFSILSPYFCANVDYDGVVNIQLFHALNDDIEPVFKDRGNITITSLRAGSSVITNNVLSPEEKQQLKELAASGGFYRLKAIARNLDGSEIQLHSYVKACMLAESTLTDVLTVSLDFAGMVIAVTESVPGATLCSGATLHTDRTNKFHTAVNVQHTEQGPIPDTASYIQKIEREREARERGESKDNRSFLAKYWMYIVPVVIFMVISSAANPEGAAGGGAAATR